MPGNPKFLDRVLKHTINKVKKQQVLDGLTIA